MTWPISLKYLKVDTYIQGAYLMSAVCFRK